MVASISLLMHCIDRAKISVRQSLNLSAFTAILKLGKSSNLLKK